MAEKRSHELTLDGGEVLLKALGRALGVRHDACCGVGVWASLIEIGPDFLCGVGRKRTTAA